MEKDIDKWTSDLGCSVMDGELAESKMGVVLDDAVESEQYRRMGVC